MDRMDGVGFEGSGNGLYWQPKKDMTYLLHQLNVTVA